MNPNNDFNKQDNDLENNRNQNNLSDNDSKNFKFESVKKVDLESDIENKSFTIKELEDNNLEEYSNEEYSAASGESFEKNNEKPNHPILRFFWNINAFLKKYRKQIIILFLILFIIGAVSVSASAIWLMDKYRNIGDIVNDATKLDEGSIVYDRNEKELFRYNAEGQQREVVSIKEIPENIQGAIIALEDENYYQNAAGIPWENLVGATIKCLVPGAGDCRGGSGLSQQLIKNVTGNDQRSTSRKINELLAAIKYNQEVKPGGTEKEKQDAVLEAYLNWVPFGRNTYGIKAASKTYFNKDISTQKLTIPESCYMASMVQKPSTFASAIDIEIKNRQLPDGEKLNNPNWEGLENRKNICIQKMYELNLKNYGTEKFITTQEEADNLKKEVVQLQPRPVSQLAYGHLRDYITSELSTKFNISEGNLATSGYKIYTTFDKDIQDQVQNIVTSSIASRIAPNGGNNSAAMILDGPTGQIISMIGSADFNNASIGGQVNVTTAPRQPGSSYKPYVYASAFENNFNPGTVLIDSTTDFGNYTPRNFSRTTRGATTIRSSLQDSLNIPAVKAAYLSQGGGNNPNATAGINNVMSFAEKTGVNHPFKQNCTLSAAIGGCEITMISHSTGINTLLQNGNLRTAKPFLKIIDRNGVDIYDQNRDNYQDVDRVIDPLVARQIANVMSDYNSRSAGTWGNGRRTLQLDGWDGQFSVAAKTGTTNDVKDVWTVGGTPLYTVSVWAGNTDAKPMKSSASSTVTAAQTWKEIMTLIHANKQKVGFSKEGLKNFSIDPTTGLPGEGRNELLTDNQIKALQTAQQNLNKQDYNPAANSILTNRTPVVSRKLKVSKLDKKLIPEIVEGQNPSIPAELIEEINCKQVVSEFPTNANWVGPVQAIQQSLKEQACPTEITNPDLTNQQPKITTNIEKGESLPEEIIINVSTEIQGANITKISFSVGGQEIKSIENNNRLIVNIKDEKLKGTKDIIIKAEDSLGLKAELIIENVDFDDIQEKSSSSSKSSSSRSSSISSSSSRSSSTNNQSSATNSSN